MTRNTFVGLTLAVFCIASPSAWAQGKPFYAKDSADWAKLTWYADKDLKTPAEGAPGAEDTVYLGAGTITIKDGDTVALHSLWMDAIARSESTTINQTGGTVTLSSADLPATYDAAGSTPALYVGYQGGNGSSAIYNLKGGTLSAREGYIYIGGGSWTNALNLSGGLLRAKGVTGSGNQEFAFNLQGGIAALGEGGLVVPKTTTTDRKLTFAGGMLLFEGDATLEATSPKLGTVPITGKPVFAALSGKTMTVKGTFSGTGTLVIGSQEAFDGVACDGTVDLSGATLNNAGVELIAGKTTPLDFGTRRGVVFTVGQSVATEAYAVTLRLTAEEEAAGLANSLLAKVGAFELSRLTLLASDGTPMGTEGVSISPNGMMLWSKEGLPAVSFTPPASWGYGVADIPQVAATYAPSATFSLYSQADAAQTLNGRKARVGQLSGSGNVFGGLGDNDVAATAEADVWMKVVGGTYDCLVGGSNKWGNSGKKAVTTTGNRLIEMTGGTAKDIIGGDYGDGQAPSAGFVLKGNIAIRIAEEAKVTGSVVVGTIGQHTNKSTVEGNTTLTVANLQSDNSASTLNAPGKGYFIAGAAWGGNSGTQSLVSGNASLLVELGDTAEGTFAKHLIGGAGHFGSNNHADSGKNPQTVQGDASLSVHAPQTVTFTGTLVGGAWVDNAKNRAGSARIGGNAMVSLEGGVYTGTIVAGGYGTHATVSGAATLTLKGGDFSVATMLPGNAEGVTTLAVQCKATVKALTAFDVIDLSAANTSLSVTEAFVLPAGGTVEVRLPEETVAGATIPLTLPADLATETTAARFVATVGARRFLVRYDGAKFVASALAVTLGRPATEAWKDVALGIAGMSWMSVPPTLYLAGDAAYDASAGDTAVSAARVSGTGAENAVFGGMYGTSSANATVTMEKPIRLQVTGGDFQRIFGGSDASGWNGGKNYASIFKGDILVEMTGGKTDYLSAASWNDGKDQTYLGNLAVVLSGDAVVTGSVFGGGGASHGYPCVYGTEEAPVELSVTVRNVQNDNSSSLVYFNENGGSRVGAIVGGAVWATSSDPKQTIHGATAVVVELPESAAGQTFSKQLIGGMWVEKDVANTKPESKNAVLSISGRASVSVSAPGTTRFDKDVTGGHWVNASFAACPITLGSSAVTLDGGIYEGTVTAGSLGGKDNGLGAATLTVGAKGATFKGKVQGGVAASKALALDGTLTLDGGTLELASFDSVSGEGAVAVEAGTLNVGALRASEDFGTLKVAKAAKGTIAVTWEPATGDTVVLPLVGDGLTSEAFAVSTEEGAFVAIAAIEPAENATTLRMSSFIPPLKAAGVAGEGLDWAGLAWQGSDGEAAPANAVADWTGGRTLELVGDASVTLASAVSATPFAIQGTGTLTLSAAKGGKLTAGTVAVGTDAVLEAGAATLSGVTIAAGKTLTVRDTNTLSLTTAGAAKGAGTLRMEGVTVTRGARPAEGEAMLEVGRGATLTLTGDGSSQIPAPLTVSGNGVLELKGKDVIGWNPSTAQLRNTRVIAREQGIVRNPSEQVESVRCTYEMGGASRLEVGKVKETDTGAYSAGFTLCRGARFIATDGAAGIYGLAGVEGAAIALRCTETGSGIAGEYTFVEFEVRPEATFTVDVPLRHYACESYSDFPVRKTGAGTLVLTKPNPATGNPLHIEAGTVHLAGGATWEDTVSLKGTLEVAGAASVTALTLNEGATLSLTSGSLAVTDAVTLAKGVEAVAVMLAEGAKPGDVVLACAEPTAEVAAALKAEGFTVAAVAGTGYVLTSAEPTPKNPEAFDATTLAQLRKDAAAGGLTDGFAVEVHDLKEALVGHEEFAANLLACFQGVTSAADPETNVLTYTYAFGITAAKANVAEGTVAVTVSIRGGALRPGTMVQLVMADTPANVLDSQTVPNAETPASDLTLTVPIGTLTRPFKAKVVTPAQTP